MADDEIIGLDEAHSEKVKKYDRQLRSILSLYNDLASLLYPLAVHSPQRIRVT